MEARAVDRESRQESRALRDSSRRMRGEADEHGRSSADARSHRRCEHLQEELEGTAQELKAEQREVQCERRAAESREQARWLLEAELNRRSAGAQLCRHR